MKRKKGPRKLKPVPWLWLSFCDPDKPEGESFLGVVIIQGRTIEDAIRRAHRLKINPGGQVLTFQLPPAEVPPEEFRERLLRREDIIRLQGEAKTLGDLERENPEAMHRIFGDLD